MLPLTVCLPLTFICTDQTHNDLSKCPLDYRLDKQTQVHVARWVNVLVYLQLYLPGRFCILRQPHMSPTTELQHAEHAECMTGGVAH